ncbi:arsenic resistance protein [Candidatus Methanocrinis natronophilus]|uniref:Arsenic resistance protein n=1 Tax=Candidatus Methanocrinis natronophilus TaxID=3033396 RepID=A0ABT5X4Z2_9EURY|nr:hypothetical protein [Candidatus Methanocrinis natronophilus]MDF0589763.1 hypothetical protein [Candidatus Methanocrinis natronophilus]
MNDLRLSSSEKLQSVFILLSIGFGLGISRFPQIAQHGGAAILPALMLMLYIIFLQMPLERLGRGFANLKVAGLSLTVNFLFTPFFAFGLGYLFLRSSPDLWVGFFMLMLTPCTDWYLVFTSMAKGDVGLGASLLPWNLFLQLALLPLYLALLAGYVVPIDVLLLGKSVVLVVVLPLGTAYSTRIILTRAKSGEFFREVFLAKVGGLHFPFLLVAITGMFVSQGQAVADNPFVMANLLAPIMIFFTTIYIISQIVAKLFGFTYPEMASFTCTTIARNSPLALAIAVTAFPDQPLIALTLVIGPLIELPVLIVITRLLLKRRKC